jgi:hypothetical protein
MKALNNCNKRLKKFYVILSVVSLLFFLSGCNEIYGFYTAYNAYAGIKSNIAKSDNQYLSNSIIQNGIAKENKTENEAFITDGQTCLRCGWGHYKNGYCDLCGAASPERVNRSIQNNAPACDICKGKGFIRGANGDSIICPSCKGTGKETF